MKNNLTIWLAYLGTIPFILSAVLVLQDNEGLMSTSNLTHVLNSYALIIVVFMAGVHWGCYLSDEKSHSISLLLISNVITLIAWFAFLLTPFIITLLIYCLAFVVLLFIDSKLLSLDVISKEYFKLRLTITSIVIMSLLLVVSYS
ncbi:MAG: DUF3429 domain-containing protein [Gammaproteobacteria bacterium]